MLAAEAFRHNPLPLLLDLVVRYMLPNWDASVSAPGYGGLAGSALRNGRFDPDPGEASNSRANLFTQAATSFENELTWRLYQALFAIFEVELNKLRTERLESTRQELVFARENARFLAAQALDGIHVRWENYAERGEIETPMAPLPAEAELARPAAVTAMLSTIEADLGQSPGSGRSPDPAVRVLINALSTLARLDERYAAHIKPAWWEAL